MYRKVELNLLVTCRISRYCVWLTEESEGHGRFEQLNCSESSYDGYKHREIAAKNNLAEESEILAQYGM